MSTRPEIVVKFGGSSLKKNTDIRKILDLVEKYRQPLVIVVSAFFGITDHLEEMLWKTQKDDSKISWLSDFLGRLKRDIINENIRDPKDQEEVYNKVCERISILEKYLTGAFYIGDIPTFLEDLVLSYGERLSSLLISEYLRLEGIACRELLPEDMGLITDGEFGNATVDLPASNEKVNTSLSDPITYIVPGFYGMSKEGKATLLGRGGSDYSAAAIARCINAKSLDIWKDVNGFMSADPKLVPAAEHIDRLSYTEAAELAYFGARILHPRTVEPLQEAAIPIRIFNIDRTKCVNEPFTTISSNGVVREGSILKSVTYSDDFSILKMKGAGVGVKPGILARATTEMDHLGINIKSVITSQTSINFLLSNRDLPRAHHAIRSLEIHAVSSLEIRRDLCLIAVVGEGILDQHGIAAGIFTAVSAENINIKLISVGASQVAAYFIVDDNDKKRTIQAIHRHLFP